MAINWDVLRSRIIDAAVLAVNVTGEKLVTRAKARAPVRKVFAGGRQTVRFKTASEINADAGLRRRLGLAPELLATPERIAAIRAAGRNPKGRFHSGGKEFGLATTIEHPGSNRRGLAQTGLTDLHSGAPMMQQTPSRAERGLTVNRRNRANTFEPGGEELRKLDITGTQFLHPGAARKLSVRGVYEFTKAGGRAIATDRPEHSRQTRTTLGGRLRASIKLVEASASQYPVIKASVVAGGPTAPYAKYQELGTRHNPAHPFLRPSLAEAREDLPDQLRRAIRGIRR